MQTMLAVSMPISEAGPQYRCGLGGRGIQHTSTINESRVPATITIKYTEHMLSELYMHAKNKTGQIRAS